MKQRGDGLGTSLMRARPKGCRFQFVSFHCYLSCWGVFVSFKRHVVAVPTNGKTQDQLRNIVNSSLCAQQNRMLLKCFCVVYLFLCMKVKDFLSI